MSCPFKTEPWRELAASAFPFLGSRHPSHAKELWPDSRRMRAAGTE